MLLKTKLIIFFWFLSLCKVCFFHVIVQQNKETLRICPSNNKCVPKIQCPQHLDEKSLKLQECNLPDGEFGFCCIMERNLLKEKVESDKTTKILTSKDFLEKVTKDYKKLNSSWTGSASRSETHRSPSFYHSILFRPSPEIEYQMMRASLYGIRQKVATSVYAEMENIDFRENFILPRLSNTPLAYTCPQTPECKSEYKYRTADGTCNNLKNPLRGAAGQPMERLLSPAYEDGIWEPRSLSVTGELLPNSRDISRILLPDIHRPHPKYNLLLMQFGQFISHDLTQSSSYKFDNGKEIECCNEDGIGPLPRDMQHFACLPIYVNPNDEFYSEYEQRCINFVRLSLAPNSECQLGYGKQLSMVTGYLDGSTIYGSDIETQFSLRSFEGGKLLMSENSRGLLPESYDPKTCESVKEENVCFKAGDVRVNQIISLTALHVLFMREHNRIADILTSYNPDYSDEDIFQEARRIVIAELQHITYKEWLPLVIGDEAMARFEIHLKEYGYSDDYDPNITAAVSNEFTGAAFRFGHSSVAGTFSVHNDHIDEEIEIPDVMFESSRLYETNFFDSLINTLLAQPMQQIDDSITYGLTRYLFRGQNPFGMDLAALNIQRGRDHALRSYNDYLWLTGQEKINDFIELKENGLKLSKVYQTPQDIDLWIGGLMEQAVHDGIVGRTFVEIIADQFARLRRGDRFFYEHSSFFNNGAFTIEQLTELRKTSMSRIICDNSDDPNRIDIMDNAFHQSNTLWHPVKHCDDISGPRFEPWKRFLAKAR